MKTAKHRYLFFSGLFLALCLGLIPAAKIKAATPYGRHGALKVKGTQLVDKKGKAFQIRGISTHGLAWYPQYVNKKAFRTLRDDWGVNCIRLAMYTAEYGGYLSGGDKKELEAVIHRGVKAATDLGMYVIIDWHILSDGDPNAHTSESKAFFKKMAKKYAKNKHVIYEICNEPNGGVSWPMIRTYANKVIPVIRKYSPRSIILVGTPNWSQDVDQAAASPVKLKTNVMYSLHFYAGTHKEWLRDKAETALKAGCPIFVSEFSICDASGNGGVDKTEASRWKKFLNNKKISYVAWSLSNKDESASLIKPNCRKTSGWKLSDLSDTGKWIRKMMQGK